MTKIANHKGFRKAQHPRRKLRQEEAANRLAEWRKLTPEQMVKSLDMQLGVGVGAKKQRARLAKIIKK